MDEGISIDMYVPVQSNFLIERSEKLGLITFKD